MHLPIINLNGSDSVAAADVAQACSTYGFFYLSGHNIPPSLILQLFSTIKQFFNLSLSRKESVLATPLTKNRGYTRFYEETLDPNHQSCGDSKEGYYIGRHVDVSAAEYLENPFAGPNVWPDEEMAPKFREICETYHQVLTECAMRVVRLLSLSLGLNYDYFDPYFTYPTALLRLLHYNNEKSCVRDGKFGAGAHTDYGMITLLLTDAIPGLQIYDNITNEWCNVEYKEGCLIVNLGDLLQRWTNNTYKSTLHRVLTNGEERYSIPFFFEPNVDAPIIPLSQFVSCDHPPLYPPTTAGEHLMDMYEKTQTGYKR